MLMIEKQYEGYTNKISVQYRTKPQVVNSCSNKTKPKLISFVHIEQLGYLYNVTC